MANRIRPIVVSHEDRHELERLQRASSTPAGLSRRARAVLLMAQGLAGVEIAERTGYTVVQVSRLRRRFAEHGLNGLHDRPRSGRPPTITARKRAQIVALTLKPAPAGLTHWSTRDLARKTGVSHGTVHRLWRAHALQPHRISTFKFTTDPAAEDKIYDVVGLYLNPPTNVVVLSLSRTQPLLPLRPGLPARQTHDYRRNGLTSLYAALEVPRAGAAHRPRQLVHALDPSGAGLARPASRDPVSLHAERRVLAEPGRGVVRHPDPQVGPARLVRHRPGSRPPHRGLHRGVE